MDDVWRIPSLSASQLSLVDRSFSRFLTSSLGSRGARSRWSTPGDHIFMTLVGRPSSSVPDDLETIWQEASEAQTT